MTFSTMTNHTIDKTTAQKLAEAGVDVESEFKWWKKSNTDEWWEVSNIPGMHNYGYDGYIPAYLLSELLEVLPRFIENKGNKYNALLAYCPKESVEIGKRVREHSFYYSAYNDEDNKEETVTPSYEHTDSNPANAAASLLLWLIEQGHIDPNNLES